ncbi:MAG TPA: hypothetical protein VF491_09225 [Vicinamibacterales bacterium]|jgi:hypothetical protein
MAVKPGSRGRIIVFGILFWYPLAGVTYQFLHYLLALRRLGYDPYYIEDSGRWVYDPALNDLSPDAGPNIDAVAPVLEAHGFAGRWAFRGHYQDGRCYGMTDAQILDLYGTAAAFLNVTGAQEIREEHLKCPRRIYVESDPFSSQVNVANGNAGAIATLDAHDTHFTFGENIGQPDCGIPVGRYNWLPTRQPVAMDLWRHSHGDTGAPFTTITTWHNTGKDVVYNGERYYWTKDREFEHFIDLPLRREGPFELAVGVDDAVRQRLESNRWRLRRSIDLSASVTSYRDYIQRSRGEFTVARDQYVRPRTGWFSDRTACYLAASRPVITQDTGFGKYIPTGRGLFAFTSMDDVLAAVDAIESDYAGHCAAAGEIADEYFGAERVVGSLMSRAGL